VQIEVIERQKAIEVQEQEALRKVKELEATIRKPAEAEQFRIETIANANKFEVEARAAGDAAAIRARGEAEADAIKAKGLAEAEVIRQKGLAEAEAMEKKAAAWKQYNQAAIIQQVIEGLPELAAAISAPLAQTDRIVVISTGDGAGAGASKISADITNIIAQVPATIEALTGLDITKAISQLPGIAGTKTEES
jgi:flotillin